MRAHKNTMVCGRRIAILSSRRANSNLNCSSLVEGRINGSMLPFEQSKHIETGFTRANFTPTRSQKEQDTLSISSTYLSEDEITSDESISNNPVYSEFFLKLIIITLILI
jgi:hypothetical protein